MFRATADMSLITNTWWTNSNNCQNFEYVLDQQIDIDSCFTDMVYKDETLQNEMPCFLL